MLKCYQILCLIYSFFCIFSSVLRLFYNQVESASWSTSSMLCVKVNFVRKKWLFVRLQLSLQVLKNFPQGTKQRLKKVKKGSYLSIFAVCLLLKLNSRECIKSKKKLLLRGQTLQKEKESFLPWQRLRFAKNNIQTLIGQKMAIMIF